MSQDVIPGSDPELDKFQKFYIDTIVAAPAPYDHTAQDLGRLQAAQAIWTPAYVKHQQAQVDAGKASQVKDESRVALVAELRSSIRKVNAMPSISNGCRSQFAT